MMERDYASNAIEQRETKHTQHIKTTYKHINALVNLLSAIQRHSDTIIDEHCPQQIHLPANMNASSINILGLVPPILSSYGSGAWFTFLDKYETYRMAGGTVKLASLISSDVIQLYSFQSSMDIADDETAVIKSITGAFMPPSLADAMESLRALKMPESSTFSEEALLQYLKRIHTFFKRLPDTIKLDPKKARDIILRGMRPMAFANRIDSQCPADVKELQQLMLKELERAKHAQLYMQSLNPATGRVTSSSSASAPAYSACKLPRTTSAPQPCHGCGHPGHIRPNCPHKNHPGFISTGIRRDPIKNSPTQPPATGHPVHPASPPRSQSSSSTYQVNARQVATPPPTQPPPVHHYGTRFQQQQQQQQTGDRQRKQLNSISEEVPPADSVGQLNAIHLMEPWPLVPSTCLPLWHTSPSKLATKTCQRYSTPVPPTASSPRRFSRRCRRRLPRCP